MTRTGAVKAGNASQPVIFIHNYQLLIVNPAAPRRKKNRRRIMGRAGGRHQDLVCTRSAQSTHKLRTSSSSHRLESVPTWPHIVLHDRNVAATTGDEVP